MDRYTWIGLIAVMAPALVAVSGQCRKVGIRPVWPIIGVVVGLLVELSRE